MTKTIKCPEDFSQAATDWSNVGGEIERRLLSAIATPPSIDDAIAHRAKVTERILPEAFAMRPSLGARLCRKDRVSGTGPRQIHRCRLFSRRCEQIDGGYFGVPGASMFSIKIELFDHPAIFDLCNAGGEDALGVAVSLDAVCRTCQNRSTLLALLWDNL
jgi:hypothetical protein